MHELHQIMTHPSDPDAEITVIGEMLDALDFSIDTVLDHEDREITLTPDEMARLYSAVSESLAGVQYDAAWDYDDSSDWK